MDFKEVLFSQKDYIMPSYINLNNPKYFEIDEMFYSTLIAVNYYREQDDLILKNLIDTNINMNISICFPIFNSKLRLYKRRCVHCVKFP